MYVYIYIYILILLPRDGGFNERRINPTRPRIPCLLRNYFEGRHVDTERAPSNRFSVRGARSHFQLLQCAVFRVRMRAWNA